MSVFANESPIDGEALEPVEATAPDEVGDLVVAAREAQRVWADKPLGERVDILIDIKNRILSRAEEIAMLVHREVGKPIEEAALAEVLPNADLVAYWCDSIEELVEGQNIDLDPLAYPGKRGRIHHDPRGVVALITPWNFPVAIPLRSIIPALLSGNAVVFKPSEITPRSGALVASLFDGLLPDGLLTLVQGGADVGKALVAADVDLVVFTGSVPTGRAIAVACAERLLPCSLELGGKDAAIVTADCDLERTAHGVVWGAFNNAGQNCAAIERVYVVEEIADKFIERVVAVTEELRPGVDTAYMTTSAQKAKVEAHLADAIEAGAEVLAGGDPEEGTLAFPPTVVKVDDDASDRTFMQEETFGPLLPIAVVKDVDEAVERVNASRYALTTSIWTKRIRWAHQEIARKLQSGVVTVNNHGFTAALPAAPWTGTGDTGYGITNSPHTLHAMTRVRFVLEDRNSARELWWYPYTPVLRTIAFAMAAVRGGAGFFGRIVALGKLISAFPKRLLGG